MILCLFIGSCDLLKPRDPQPPPSGQGNTANPPAFAPETVIENLQASFNGKNVNDYEKIFSDTSSVGRQYVFVPTQRAAGDFSALFAHWTIESELNYFNKATKGASITFPPIVSIPQSNVTKYHSDSSLIEANYSVLLWPNTYAGHARFYLIPNKKSGTWVVYRWEDLQSAQDTSLSWSDMKGQFSQ